MTDRNLTHPSLSVFCASTLVTKVPHFGDDQPREYRGVLLHRPRQACFIDHRTRRSSRELRDRHICIGHAATPVKHSMTCPSS